MAKYLVYFDRTGEESQTAQFDSVDECLDMVGSLTRRVMTSTNPDEMPIVTFSIGDITAISRD